MDFISIVVAIIILAVYAVDRFFLKKQASSVTMEKEVREAILSLFLFAEKQGWPDQVKMTYVHHKIEDLIPGKWLEEVMGEEHLTGYLQKAYDMFKDRLYK